MQFSRFGSYSDFSVLKLVVKPVYLLLEDQRSKTSSKADNQTSALLFMKLVHYLSLFLCYPVRSNSKSNLKIIKNTDQIR